MARRRATGAPCSIVRSNPRRRWTTRAKRGIVAGSRQRGPAMLPTPSFHHIHLNAVDPDASIAFYTRQFPSTSATVWGGHKALASPNNCLVLFNKVDTPPPTQPQSAIWHFGWHVADTRKTLGDYIASPEVNVLPLYTSEAGGSVFVSSDTWPSIGNTLGLNRRQIAEAQAAGTKPKGGGGFSYFEGPEKMLVEIAGDYRPSASTTSICGRKTRSARCSGTRST